MVESSTETAIAQSERATGAATSTWRTALLVLGMALGLAIFYRASFQLPISALGLAIFATLALLRPDLGLLFVPLTVPLYLMPKGIWDVRFGIRDEGIRFPLHEVVLLVVLASTLLRLALLHRLAGGRGNTRAFFQQGDTEIRDIQLRSRQVLLDAAPVALFLAAGTLGVALALPEGRGEALRQWRWLIVEPAIFYGLARFWQSAVSSQQSRNALWLASALALAGGGVAMVGLLQYMGIDLTPWIGQRMSHVDSVVVIDDVRRVTSIYGHPNNLGLFLGRVWPLALALAFVQTQRPGDRETKLPKKPLFFLVSCLLSLVSLLGLIITYSRGANMGALAAGAVLGWGLLRQARGASSRWTIGLGLGLLAALLLTMFRDDPASGSVNTRLLLWGEALAMLRDHPLGIGLGQFYFYHSPEFGHGYIAPALVGTSEQYAAHPHNLVLDTLLQIGPFGFVALAWLLARFFRRALAAQRNTASAEAEAALLLGLLASLVAALVHGAVDNFYFVPDLAFFFWLAIAIGNYPIRS